MEPEDLKIKNWTMSEPDTAINSTLKELRLLRRILKDKSFYISLASPSNNKCDWLDAVLFDGDDVTAYIIPLLEAKIVELIELMSYEDAENEE